jgi:hypothetical protein
MRKITSFLFLMLVCCISAVAQDVVTTEKPVGKIIKAGTAQAEMVPNQWYFVYQCREGGGGAGTQATVGEELSEFTGGFVYNKGNNENGEAQLAHKTTKAVAEAMCLETGVAYSSYTTHLLRFVPVADKEGVYNIQYANGEWMGADLKNASEFQYKAGLAGEFNFYRIKVDGVENKEGRFGWNKAPFADRVDNNGAGNGLSLWGTGEVNETEGNNVWNLFEIVIVGDEDLYWTKFEELVEYHNQVIDGSLFTQLQEGEVIGDGLGQYPEEPANQLLEWANAIGEMIEYLYTAREEDPTAVDPTYDTTEKMEQLLADYKALVKAVEDSRIPLALTNIAPGYYFLKSANLWTNTRPVYFTEETAAAYNEEHQLTEEDENFKRAGDPTGETEAYNPIKAIYSDLDNNLKWDNFAGNEKNIAYLWKIESVEGKATEYRLINMLNQLTINNIPTSDQVVLVKDDTITVSFDFRADITNPETEEAAQAISVRLAKSPDTGNNTLHCNKHTVDGGESGNGVSGNIVGWAGDAGASQWYLSLVDEATAEEILADPSIAAGKKITAMIDKADSIIAIVPAQIEIAKDKSAACDTTVNVASAEVFSSPYCETEEGSIEGGFDGDPTTFWHSKWSSANNGYAKNTTNGTNFFVINDVDGLINGGLATVLTRRNNANNDHVVEFTIYGSNDYDPSYDLETIVGGGEATGEWTELGVIKLPFKAKGETVTSSAIEFEGQYEYYKFLATETYGTEAGGWNRGYFHFAEFKLYPATISQKYETTQYMVRQTLADNLTAAIEAWEGKEFAADSLELAEDADFQAYYDALVNAYNAWAAVYTNPEALRNAIAGAPDDNLFVVGTNPGEWQKGVETPATVVAKAQAYDESGEYTPAQSEAYVKAIEDAIANVYEKANKVKDNVWYRFTFADVEMYETYGWDKTGSKENGVTDIEEEFIQQSEALWGKFVAVGELAKNYVAYTALNEDEEEEEKALTIYSSKTAAEFYEGIHLQYFKEGAEEFENGEDLFRFIPANDTAYMIQNKATGLYIRGTYPVTLSATPSYFQISAIGTGANAIRVKNVLDKEDVGYNYLHAERSTNRLTTWDVNTLGSNSMMYIKEAEPITEIPATEYTKKLWPGEYYAQTLPVSVSINEGEAATAYGAQVVVDGDKATVVLKKIEATVIEHGTPFIMIADCDEYVPYDTAWAAIEKEVIVSETIDSLYEYDEAVDMIDAKYARIKMTYVPGVDTLAHTLLDLKGTIGGEVVKAGKGITINADEFKHIVKPTSIGQYGAYIATDFGAEDEILLNAIQVEVNGSIDTGIEETLDKVVKGGNIYTVGGQLVGKGNVNTINKLPAGIYIVNGVKVIKN